MYTASLFNLNVLLLIGLLIWFWFIVDSWGAVEDTGRWLFSIDFVFMRRIELKNWVWSRWAPAACFVWWHDLKPVFIPKSASELWNHLRLISSVTTVDEKFFYNQSSSFVLNWKMAPILFPPFCFICCSCRSALLLPLLVVFLTHSYDFPKLKRDQALNSFLLFFITLWFGQAFVSWNQFGQKCLISGASS